MRLICSGLLLFSIMFQPAQAATEVAIMGFGATSCAQFANAYRDLPAAEQPYFAWAQGFMSGMNFQSTVDGLKSRNLNAAALDTQTRRLRSYCDEHPLRNYVDAILDLYSSFPFNSH